MRGEDEILELLNDVLTSELTAINQYFIHAKMCENWGYARIARKKREESIEEMKHADPMIGRILFLEGVAEHAAPAPACSVGEDVAEQHRLDLALELDARKRLNDGIALCRERRRQRHP